MTKLHPRDIVAFILCLGGLGLMFFHINGVVGGLLVTIVAFYFGLNTPTESNKDKTNG